MNAPGPITAGMMTAGTCIEQGRFELAPARLPQTAPEGWALADRPRRLAAPASDRGALIRAVGRP